MNGWTYPDVEALPQHVYAVLVTMLNRESAPAEAED